MLESQIESCDKGESGFGANIAALVCNESSPSRLLQNELRNLRNPALPILDLVPSPLDPARSGRLNGNYDEHRDRNATMGDIKRELQKLPVEEPGQKNLVGDFSVLGPRAAAIMKDFGVKSLAVKHLPEKSAVCLSLNAKVERIQDPDIDQCKKIIADKELRFDFKKEADGTIVFDAMKGMKAVAEIFGSDQSLPITKMSLRKTEDGRTEISSHCKYGIISISKVKYASAEVYDKAAIMYERVRKL